MRISSLSRRTRVSASETERRMVSARCADPAVNGVRRSATAKKRPEIIEDSTCSRRYSLARRGAVSYRASGGSGMDGGCGMWEVGGTPLIVERARCGVEPVAAYVCADSGLTPTPNDPNESRDS